MQLLRVFGNVFPTAIGVSCVSFVFYKQKICGMEIAGSSIDNLASIAFPIVKNASIVVKEVQVLELDIILNVEIAGQ